jgi:hypothetical protein
MGQLDGWGCGMKLTASATITRGAKTNRVRVKRVARSAGTAMARYRADPTVRGLETAIVCISMPAEELAALDAACERTQMARSHFLRQAAKHFAEKTRAGTEQAKRWKESIR